MTKGAMHRGPLVRAVAAGFPRLAVESLPPYARELNLVEPLWKRIKRDDLGNFVPADVPELDVAIRRSLDGAVRDQSVRGSFLRNRPPSGDGLTGLF